MATGSTYQREYYDEHYAQFAASVREQRRHPLLSAFFDMFADRVLRLGTRVRRSPDAPIRIYDPGCGEGFMGEALARVARARSLALEYTGSDLSAAALELAAETVDGRLLIGDAIEVTAALPADSADVIIAKNLLHHLDDPAGFLREAGRVAGTGRVLVAEPRFGQPFVFLGNLPFPTRERHYFKGPGRNRRAVRLAGLEIVGEEAFCWFPFEIACATRFALPRRMLSRVRKPRTLERVIALDDRLARRMPWWTEYYLWELAARTSR